MRWQACEIIFTLQSPLSLGWYNMGRVSRTRPYLPGRNLWASFTETLAYHLAGASCCESNDWFDAAGIWLKENVAFTYFYILGEGQNIMGWPDDNGQRGEGFAFWYPEYVNSVEQNLISSTVSTAIDKTTGSAEDATLHDTEVINPRFKGKKAFGSAGRLRPVQLKGYLLIRENCLAGTSWQLQGIRELSPLPDKMLDPAVTFRNISVGGDRTYGLGRLTLAGSSPRIMDAKEKLFGLYNVCEATESPLLAIPGNGKWQPLFGPLKLGHNDAESSLPEVRGDVESLSVFDNRRRKKNPYNQGLFWSPGSIIMTQEQAEVRFAMSYQGWLSYENSVKPDAVR